MAGIDKHIFLGVIKKDFYKIHIHSSIHKIFLYISRSKKINYLKILLTTILLVFYAA